MLLTRVKRFCSQFCSHLLVVVLRVQAFFVGSRGRAGDSLLFEMKWGESKTLHCLKLVFLVIRGCSLAASFLTSVLFHVTIFRSYSLALLQNANLFLLKEMCIILASSPI